MEYNQNTRDGRPYFFVKEDVEPGDSLTVITDGLEASMQIFIGGTGSAEYMVSVSNDNADSIEDESTQYIDYQDDNITEDMDFIIDKNTGAILITNDAGSTDAITVVVRAS